MLRTDHAALQWLRCTPEPIAQQRRSSERLAEFEFQVMHQLGRQHGNADALFHKLRCTPDQCGHETWGEVVAGTEVAEPIITDDELGQRDSLGKERVISNGSRLLSRFSSDFV